MWLPQVDLVALQLPTLRKLTLHHASCRDTVITPVLLQTWSEMLH
jgi:hypothetical protein